MPKTFLLELRDAAKQCSNLQYRELLKTAADRIQFRLDQIFHEPTQENMVTLNGAWARAVAVLRDVPPEAEPTPPVSSAAEVMPMRMAA